MATTRKANSNLPEKLDGEAGPVFFGRYGDDEYIKYETLDELFKDIQDQERDEVHDVLAQSTIYFVGKEILYNEPENPQGTFTFKS